MDEKISAVLNFQIPRELNFNFKSSLWVRSDETRLSLIFHFFSKSLGAYLNPNLEPSASLNSKLGANIQETVLSCSKIHGYTVNPGLLIVKKWNQQ